VALPLVFTYGLFWQKKVLKTALVNQNALAPTWQHCKESSIKAVAITIEPAFFQAIFITINVAIQL
jgi:hypothetical protein